MSAVRSFTNQMEYEKEMEIKDLIMKSSENMRSAIAIESSVTEYKIALIEKLFKAIEEKVGRKNLKMNMIILRMKAEK